MRCCNVRFLLVKKGQFWPSKIRWTDQKSHSQTALSETTTLNGTKIPWTLAQREVGNRPSCSNTASCRSSNKAKIFRHIPLLNGPSVDLGHYVPWAKGATGLPEAVLPTAWFWNPFFQSKISSKRDRNQMLVSVARTWRPGTLECRGLCALSEAGPDSPTRPSGKHRCAVMNDLGSNFSYD